MINNTKVTLATDDTLKCPACGHEEFSFRKKQKEIDGKMTDCWVAICDSCGNVMKFHKEIKAKS